MKNLTCCFTGHRKIPENEEKAIQKRLELVLSHLIHQGVCHFCAGGALDFDTMAALAVLKLKTAFPHIRLILVLPCKEQTKGWANCMQKRNRHLVDHSTFCICYLSSSKGGTAYTVGYAKRKGLKIIHLANSCPRQEIGTV